MPRNEYDAQIKALRQPTSVPDDVGAMGTYTHPVTNERLSALATDSHAGPTATIQFEDTGKLANIYPGDELPDGFVVEEITPEGVVVLPETGPRQIWALERNTGRDLPESRLARALSSLIQSGNWGSAENSAALDRLRELFGAEAVNKALLKDLQGYSRKYHYTEAQNDADWRNRINTDYDRHVNDDANAPTTVSDWEGMSGATAVNVTGADGINRDFLDLGGSEGLINVTGHPAFQNTAQPEPPQDEVEDNWSDEHDDFPQPDEE